MFYAPASVERHLASDFGEAQARLGEVDCALKRATLARYADPECHKL